MPHIKLTRPDGTVIEIEVPSADLVPTLEKLLPVKAAPFVPAIPQWVRPYTFSYRCADGCQYPTAWLGIYPPGCLKCGQQAFATQATQPTWTLFTTTSSLDVGAGNPALATTKIS